MLKILEHLLYITIYTMHGLAHKVEARTRLVSNEGFGESVYMCKLVRAFAACINNIWM